MNTHTNLEVCTDAQEVLDAGRAEHHVLRLRNRILHVQAAPPLPRVRPGVLLEVRGPLPQQPPIVSRTRLSLQCGPHWPVVSCSAQSLPGEQFGYLGPVRVCNYCYNLHNTVPCVWCSSSSLGPNGWPAEETDTCGPTPTRARLRPARRRGGRRRAYTARKPCITCVTARRRYTTHVKSAWCASFVAGR
jgi:hypothetical protein